MIENGLVTSDVLNAILDEGRPLAYENSLWDFKKQFPNNSGYLSDEKKDLAEFESAEFVKDVVAFYNSFGGYIIGGIDEKSNELPFFQCPNILKKTFSIDKLGDKIEKYTRSKIDLKYNIVKHAYNGATYFLGVLYIPQRSLGEPVVKMLRQSPEKKGKRAFEKGTVYARISDACVPNTADANVMPFVCSDRNWLPEKNQQILENNLPDRDPNLIRFVGRTAFLEILWNWMADRTAPIRIITALGGTGKTSLAYEFCKQLVENKPSWLSNVVWLSAKKRYFSAINDKYTEITKVDFFDSSSFLKSALMELGAIEQDINECDEEEDELIELFVDNVSLFPSLIVIDDIDSLEIEEQRNLFSILNVIAGRVASSGVKFIFTSRLDFGAVGQRIKLEGFPEKEFKQFAKMVSEERGVKLGDDQIRTIFKGSLGSPVFCSSILRLVSLGTSVYEATKAWKDRAGEDVRKFAFERELELLTESQARVLFALTVLGEASQLELRKILEVDEARLIDDLTQLRDFHLYSVNDNPSSGSLLSVSNPVALMQELIRKRITDPTRIERECGRARRNSPKGDNQVASAIGAVLALRSDDAHDEALVVARTASKKIPKSGDLHCMLGSCYLSVSPSKPSEAEKSFKRAYDNSCKRPELFRLWIEAKWKIQDYIGILDLEKIAPDRISGTTAFYVIESLETLARQSMGNGDNTRAIGRHRDAMRKASYYLRVRRSNEVTPQIRETCKGNARSYIILVDRFSNSDADRLNVFGAVYDAFKCHVTDASYLRLGAKALFDWSNDALRKRGDQPAVHKILDDRLFDLSKIIKLLKKEGRDENLIGDLERVFVDVSNNYSDAKSIHRM